MFKVANLKDKLPSLRENEILKRPKVSYGIYDVDRSLLNADNSTLKYCKEFLSLQVAVCVGTNAKEL